MTDQRDDEIFAQTLDEETSDEVGQGELIHAYQALIDKTAEEENVNSSALSEAIDMAENLFEAVTRTHEAAIDSALMRMVSSHGRKLAAAALPDQNLDPEEFAARVRNLVSGSLHGGPLDIKAWAKLTDFAAGALKTSAPFWYLHGSAGEVPIKVRRAPTVRKVAPNGPPTLPKKLSSVKETAEETTTGRVDEIYHILQRLHKRLGKPVPYFEFVLHPRSFGKTCENIFHVSFLLSRGQAHMSCDDSGQLLVAPVPKDTPHRPGHSYVMTFTVEQWQHIVQKLRITHPVIPE